MAGKKEINDNIDRLTVFKTITQAYQQVAGNNVRLAKNSVVSSRDFIGELLALFQEVKTSYRVDLEKLVKKKKIKDINKASLIKNNGRTAAVFLSANAGLYGGIVNKTADMVKDFLKVNKADLVVLGKVGNDIFGIKKDEQYYRYFDFSDSKVDMEQLKLVIKLLLEYEKTFVFYGQFQSIVSQDPIIASIDGSISLGTDEIAEKIRKYLYEPSLEEVIIFFQREIFGLVFEQTVRESQLAKHASRMYSLDRAIQNIEQNLSKVNKQHNVLHHYTINSKQQNILSSMSLWES